MRKHYDMCAKIGEYTGKDGKIKAQWLNIGAVMLNDDNSPFILLNRSFNPAGVPCKDGNTAQILISLFPAKETAKRD